MDELILAFKSESQELVGQMTEILESIEGDYSQHRTLEQYGQLVDRIMGTAKCLALSDSTIQSQMASIGKYSELCKTIAYKGSQISDNLALYDATVALLLDSTEILDQLIASLGIDTNLNMKTFMNDKFLERLNWLESQFPKGLRGTLASNNDNIQELLTLLGVQKRN